MGQKDIILANYFEDQERYADLINGFIFGGEQVVSGQDVQEMDTRELGVWGKLKQRFTVQKYRDSVRMEYEELPDKLKGILNNYQIQVLEIEKLEDIDRFKTDLREVFGFIQRSGDKVSEREFTFANEEKFQSLDEEAFDVIVSITGASELEHVKEAYRKVKRIYTAFRG